MCGSTFSCVGSSIWFTLQLNWTRRSGRTGNDSVRLGRHLILGYLLLLPLFLMRSVVGNGVTDIDSSRRGGLNIGTDKGIDIAIEKKIFVFERVFVMGKKTK
jgi:hypothetical protein